MYAGNGFALARERVVQVAAAAVERAGNAVHAQRRVTQVLCHMGADAVAQGFALGQGGLLARQLQQRQLHQLLDELARALGGGLAHVGQLLVRVAHGLQRHARDAAGAQVARHGARQAQAALDQVVLGHHHDQVVHGLGVGYFIRLRGVVDDPGA
jgi:hypothetical protein